jgi:DNA-binding NarL/FixJ family response regulator
VKRLGIVADNSLIVEAIRIGLRESGEFRLVAQDKEWGQMIVDEALDVVLVDDMDGGSRAADLVRQIKTEREDIVVIVLATKMDRDDEWLDAIFEAGADGAISKEAHPTALATLIRETADGHVVHVYTYPRSPDGSRPGTATRPVATTGADKTAIGPSQLTARELEVLRLVAAGSTNGEIAGALWVTEQTVKFHLSNVYRKLDVGNRTQASHYAHVNGWLGSAPSAVALAGKRPAVTLAGAPPAAAT